MIEGHDNLRDDPAFMLAVLYTCGFLGIAFLVILRDTPGENSSTVQQIISIMSMIQAAIAGYFYGASKSGKENQKASDDRKVQLDNTITDIARKASNLPPTAPAIPPADSPLTVDKMDVIAKGEVNVKEEKP